MSPVVVVRLVRLVGQGEVDHLLLQVQRGLCWKMLEAQKDLCLRQRLLRPRCYRLQNHLVRYLPRRKSLRCRQLDLGLLLLLSALIRMLRSPVRPLLRCR